MKIKVCRFTDINPMPDIVDDLMTTEQVALERGRNELDQKQFSRSIYICTLPLNEDISPGDIVEVQENAAADVWIGKVTGVTINVADPAITHTLRIDRALT